VFFRFYAKPAVYPEKRSLIVKSRIDERIDGVIDERRTVMAAEGQTTE